MTTVNNITTAELIAELKKRGMSSDDILNALIGTIAATPATMPTQAPAESLEVRVTELLCKLGVPAHIKGHRYVRRGIILAVEDPTITDRVTKELYPSLAKEFGTTASRVERAMRHAIEVAWERGDTDTMNKVFGYTISAEKGKPTNSEFVAMLADRLRMESK